MSARRVPSLGQGHWGILARWTMELICSTMEVMKTFEYRLYPNKEQARLLMACLIESRHLYNQMLAASKRQRRDFHFKVAKAYSEQYQQIAVENLNIDGMVKNHHLAKSILDASWGAFLDILEAKAENAGHRVIRVNPRFTSQACSRCGELIHKSLSVRTHICTSCGFVADRDVNAAQNILHKAGAQPSGTVSGGESG
jgi:IS605 OrfB family transposase